MKTGARAVRFARALRSRASAIRWARRRETGSPDGWRGLALRWRRPARGRSAAAPNGRTAPAAPVIWSPQFHLHLAQEARQIAQAASFIFARPMLAMRHIHHRVQRLFGTVHGAERVAGPGQWLDRLDSVVPGATPRATVTAPLLQRSASRRRRGPERVAGSVQGLERIERRDAVPAAPVRVATPQLLLPHSARRPSQRQAYPLTFGSRVRQSAAAKAAMTARSPWRATQAPHVAGSVKSRQQETTPIRMHTRRPQFFTAQPVAKPARALDHRSQTVDIVWSRKHSVTSSTAGIAPDGQTSRASAWTTAPSQASAASPVSGSRSPASSPAALKLTDIDPRLMDRLTDDVIRRVERRVRIERERRGL